MTGLTQLPAGRFSSWLRRARVSLVAESGVDVSCGGCKACCASSHFVHIRLEETRTLARIPRELLFATPGLPKGNLLLGYDQDGRCPMMGDDGCSIYEHRPVTCRTYDCRVFAAAGIAADRAAITRRVRRWRFSYSTTEDHDQHSAVQAAARFLQGHAECFPFGAVPGDPTQVAVLAVKVCDVFLKSDDESGKTRRVSPASDDIARAVTEASEKFEARRDTSPIAARRRGPLG